MTSLNCPTHGQNRLVAVCEHIVQQLNGGIPLGATADYFEADDSFQCLCSACEQLVTRHPEGLPSEVKDAMGHHVICEECMNIVLGMNGQERLV